MKHQTRFSPFHHLIITNTNQRRNIVMMLFRNHPILSLLASAVMSHQSLACSECPCDAMSIDCIPVDAPPTLDGNTDEWSIFNTTLANYPLTSAMGASRYPHGDGSASIQCVYDTDKVYFLFKVPGPYRFNNTDNHQCAAVSSMFKMGANAQLYNMGGCPLALNDCPAEEGACDDYKVDIGGHWELKTTEQGVYYTTNGGTGDDVVANKDDEYSVSPYCRMDDDDGLAANEWEGAWVYVDEATDDDIGSYTFEMARALKTDSDETDAQLEAGTEIDFGFAYWDPYEDDSTGWSGTFTVCYLFDSSMFTTFHFVPIFYRRWTLCHGMFFGLDQATSSR